MLLLIPILLFLLTAAAILIWQAVRPGFGVPWLAAVFVTAVGWGIMIFLRFRLPLILTLKLWAPLGEPSEFPAFTLDLVSWPYAFALTSLASAVVLTASARLVHQTHPRAWAGSLVVISLGILSIVSANPLTLAFTWMAIDLLELALLLGSVQDGLLSREVVVAFSVRVVGTLILLWSILAGRASGVILSFAMIPPEVSIYILLAAGLRLGVLPLNLPYMNEIPMRRGLGNVLRLVAPATSLIVLARLPAAAVSQQFSSFLLAITALVVFYSALMWLFSPDALAGRPYWLISLGGMAVASVIRGQPLASLAWGLVLILPGSLLFLYSAQMRGMVFLPILGLLSLSALPFTPSAAGWNGIWPTPVDAWSIVFVLAHAALMAGYLRHAFKPGDALASMERWIQAVYPFGLFVLIISFWLTAYFNLRASFAFGRASVALISSLLALGGLAIYQRFATTRVETEPGQPGWWAVLAERTGAALGQFFRLDWFYNLFSLIYRVLRWLIQIVTTLLEGEAGILWAIVLLVLLISLLRGGGSP